MDSEIAEACDLNTYACAISRNYTGIYIILALLDHGKQTLSNLNKKTKPILDRRIRGTRLRRVSESGVVG